MKKSSHSSDSSRRNQAAGSKNDGKWEFNLTGNSLIALGATENARRVAYRTATGELRFLPL